MDGWFLKRCSSLNISSRNHRDVATDFKEYTLPWMEEGWCGSVKDILPWNSYEKDAKELDTMSIPYPEWKRDSVVFGRMFCPEPLFVRELLYEASLLQALSSTSSPDLKQNYPYIWMTVKNVVVALYTYRLLVINDWAKQPCDSLPDPWVRGPSSSRHVGPGYSAWKPVFQWSPVYSPPSYTKTQSSMF
jgi:hypothetical protein